jgi:hypothetical protein
MGLDLNKDWSDASKKINSLKTTKELKDNEKDLKKNNTNTIKEKKSSDGKKPVSQLKGDNKKNIKSETKNQLELLLDLFKESLPKKGGQSLDTITTLFLTAAIETKNEIGELLIKLITSTLGCSEEQSYDSTINQPLYIKVKQTDLFKLLNISPTDDTAKYFYESNETSNGEFPYSMNLQMYKRLMSPNQTYSQDTTSGGGFKYKGLSGFELFDFEYVQSYTTPQGSLKTGDFFKVTLTPQLNNKTSVSDFLMDYYGSIDIFNFDILSTNIKNELTGSFSFGLDKSEEEVKSENEFMLILKRIMGICSDPNAKIDVAGTAKLSDVDTIDDSFFEPTNMEESISFKKANYTKNGVITFEDCDNVELPLNLKSELFSQDDLINQPTNIKKIDSLNKYVDDISNDPNWKKFNLQIKADFQKSIITKLPIIILKTILSPKVMFGFLIMIKSIKGELANEIDDKYDTLKDFMKTFKKFVVDFIREVTAIYVKKLFEIVKKNIKLLVESILLEIVKETKVKQLQMYSTIVYILMSVGQTITDYQNCKSVIDEILKLLNLGLTKLNLGLPPFILASASLLGGVSDTRSVSNVLENLQGLGLPTGAAPDGTPNLMNQAIASIVKGMNKEVAENGKTEVFIPPLTITPAGVTLPSKGSGKSY